MEPLVTERIGQILTLDLSQPTDAMLSKCAGRISKLFATAPVKANSEVESSLDDFLGAVYALILAKHHQFQDRTGRPIDIKLVAQRATRIAAGSVHTPARYYLGATQGSSSLSFARDSITSWNDRIGKWISHCFSFRIGSGLILRSYDKRWGSITPLPSFPEMNGHVSQGVCAAERLFLGNGAPELRVYFGNAPSIYLMISSAQLGGNCRDSTGLLPDSSLQTRCVDANDGALT